MNKGLARELYIGFSSTPILMTLIFILSLCLVLDYSVEPNDDITLECHSDVFDASVGAFVDDGFTLNIDRVSDQIEFDLVYMKENVEQEHVTIYGELVEVLAPVLTYEVKVKEADVKKDIFLEESNPHFDKTTKFVRKCINNDKSRSGQPVFIKVLEMDKSLGDITIQVSERNALWVCKIK
ncbi:hypothetical protein [Shewanella youngdeokensis]|uniref:Uncharacterized protein n=1 Tax=Shewanella youngdeokensis TaxID=2999068 RepID=A0ABZ0K0U6_9GAMM|nr:hypothetical protein RGE70_02540 [Shewanella sp. DAU334]